MKRVYKDTTPTNEVKAFIGTEVEHTIAYGKKTLFIVGLADLDKIIDACKLHNIDHVYLGANHSFTVDTNSPDEDWDTMVFGLLEQGFWVTLDYTIKYHEWVLESGYTEQHRFIPMISVRLPYIEQLGYNACIKLDDKTFDSTNSGVWVHKVHNLKKDKVYTDWSKYTQDEPVDLDV